MGRITDKPAPYQIKNTFVEIPMPPADYEYSRSQRTVSENERYTVQGSRQLDVGSSVAEEAQDGMNIPQTPSPFLRPSEPPNGMAGVSFMPMPFYGQMGMDPQQLAGDCGVAFGDFGPDQLPKFELAEYAVPTMHYDPSTGQYIQVDPCYGYMQMGCYNGMMGPGMVSADGQEHAQALLAELGQKLAEGKCEGNGEMTMDGSRATHVVVPQTCEQVEAAQMAAMEGHWDHSQMESWENWGGQGAEGYGNEEQQQHPTPSSRRRAERREAREAARRAAAEQHPRGGNGGAGGPGACDEGGGAMSIAMQGNGAEAVMSPEGATAFTTVMFRNIPNKYTREMLVNQLETDLRGQFDFVYLPIDFKNKCNVGYAFINFRTEDACQHFISNFNGVEVRKCLPGLNSRKVTEVTPARVQGFEDNVQRLRNSPVMRELAQKPEWMPLIFDQDGEQVPFPSPERPLEPIKPRRRARDEGLRNA